MFLRRHFFLVGAVVILTVLLIAGAVRLAFPSSAGQGPAGGAKPQAAAKGGPGGGPAAGRGRGGPGGAGAAATVTPTVVVLRPFTDRIEVLGVAKGRQSVTITSNTTELVTRVRFRDGQSVRQGAVLVDLKATEQDANVMVARAALDQAKRQADRWNELAGRGVAPRATAEQYQAAYDQAKAALAAAESRRGDRAIKAPFAGVVGISDIAPGALINPGAIVATLDDVSVIRVDFDVPDRFLSALAVGQPIVARPDALPGEVFRGHIAMLNTRIDEKTRSIKGRAEFPNPGRRLRPGMLVHVGIDSGQRQAAAVRESAVLFEGDTPSVFVIKHNGSAIVAEQRPVTLGVSEDGFMEVVSGLAPGEQIVADGLNRIQPGQPVRIVGAPGVARPKAAGAPT